MVPMVPPCFGLPLSDTIAIQGLSYLPENVSQSDNLFRMRSYNQGLSSESWASINNFSLLFVEEAKRRMHDENKGFSFEVSCCKGSFLWEFFFLKYDVTHIT